MAYVAISNALINSTANNVFKMRDKERETIVAPPERVNLHPQDPLLEQLVWGNHIDLRDKMPDEWKTTTKRVELRIEYTDEVGEKSRAGLTYDLSDHMQIPFTNNSSYYGFTVQLTEDDHRLDQAAKDVVAYHKNVTAIENKWKAVKSQVVAFLESAKSLNEALKLWPALALYISDEYIDRVNDSPKRVKTASKAEEILAKISVDQLTAAAVASKLS